MNDNNSLIYIQGGGSQGSGIRDQFLTSSIYSQDTFINQAHCNPSDIQYKNSLCSFTPITSRFSDTDSIDYQHYIESQELVKGNFLVPNKGKNTRSYTSGNTGSFGAEYLKDRGKGSNLHTFSINIPPGPHKPFTEGAPCASQTYRNENGLSHSDTSKVDCAMNESKSHNIMMQQVQGKGSDTDRVELDRLMSKAGKELLIAPEIASNDKTRRLLSACREIFVAVIGAQLVYVITSLLFGNIASAIIVSLLTIQSTFCHCDGRPIAYVINGLLSLSIGITVCVALVRDVSGLEPFKTEPVLRSLSYIYIPLCFIFSLLSFFLACSFRHLHSREKKAIIQATNNLVGDGYHIDRKKLVINRC
ncbi:hypothetical protein BEWA_033950 [Theileria equi strain WA]|uniref:Uncharacterized protein n=1 Tax=Theileria equi strain WA TaxID=1537102 RepID=L0AZ65_THEEQ|nr:hypothetical protein BEWA_033950 [Theileria equi strain WA]AFZ80538.1 hypothetical protein BEWA_033950 [Theileria equi strain WA]|eukprot:XP_004830204.1 hypothetical protein BEWA_033950 [Theileria equi strain WA]